MSIQSCDESSVIFCEGYNKDTQLWVWIKTITCVRQYRQKHQVCSKRSLQ